MISKPFPAFLTENVLFGPDFFFSIFSQRSQTLRKQKLLIWQQAYGIFQIMDTFSMAFPNLRQLLFSASNGHELTTWKRKILAKLELFLLLKPVKGQES